jgi:hypothetical protein
MLALLTACSSPSGNSGTVETVFTITINKTGGGNGDSVTVSPESGKAGDEVTISYTVASTSTNNRLTFSGTSATITNVYAAGSGTRKYTIAKEDATNGGITINAAFTHNTEQPVEEFAIEIEKIGNDGADSVTAFPVSGEVGDEITLTYTLANIETNNRLVFSGISASIDQVLEAGTGTKTYTIAGADATDGVITIIATFTHSDKALETIEFEDALGVTKVYGGDSFTRAATTKGTGGDGAITYTSSDETVATVISATGAVTILKAGTTTITADKAESATHSGDTASYVLTVEPLQLTITDPTGITKVYDGGTTTAVTAGALTNKVGADDVSVSAAATFASAGAGSSISVTVAYTLSGADAGNYTAPADYTGTGSITKAPGAAVNVNPAEADKTDTTITSTVVQTSGGQSVEYGISPTATDEPTTWQNGQLFDDLTPSTGYYIFARSKADDNHNAGEAKVSSEITTDAPPVMLITKYDFAAGDALPGGYPTYALNNAISTSSGLEAKTGTNSGVASGDYVGKPVLLVTKSSGFSTPRFILPFNVGTGPGVGLFNYSKIVIMLRAVSGDLNNSKTWNLRSGATTTSFGNVSTNFGGSIPAGGMAAFSKVEIPISGATGVDGIVDLGFEVGNTNPFVYEVAYIELVP